MKFLYKLVILLIFFSLQSCSKKELEVSKIKEVNQELEMISSYQEAMKNINNGDYFYAAKQFLESELLFPQSDWAPKSALMASYAYYADNYYSEAIFNLDATIPGSGIILVVLILLITGLLVTNILGRRLVALWEKLLNKIPGFRNIYNVLKKVSDTVLNSSTESFRKAFLIQYPTKGIWVIAFQSGDYQGEAKSIIGEEIINLFVPTTPNPTSGFLF